MSPSPAINTIFRWLFLAVVLFIVFSAYSMWTNGFVVQSSMTAMIPEQRNSEALKIANSRTQAIAEQNIVILLEADDPKTLSVAADTLLDRLTSHKDVLAVNDSQKNIDELIERIKPYRFGLLSNNDKQILLAKDATILEENALENIYSISSATQLLPLHADPLNQFGHYIEERLARSAMLGSGGDVGVNQKLFTVKLQQSLSAPGVQLQVNKIVDELENELTAQFPSVTFSRFGVAFFAEQAARSAKADVNRISIGSGIGISLLLLVVFRSVGPLLVPIASILIGVGFALSVFHQLFNELHVFTIVFGASLIGIVIDYSIHYFYHYAHQQDLASSHKQAHTHEPANKTDTKSPLMRALLLSLLTSVMGYGALFLSSVSVLKSIAVFSVCGIIAAWLSVMVLAPLVAKNAVKLRANLVQHVVDLLSYLIAPLARRIQLKSVVLLTLAMLIVIAGIYKAEDDPRTFVHLSGDLLEQSRKINDVSQQFEPGRYVLVQAESDDALLEKLAQFSKQLDNGARLESVANWIPSSVDQASNYALQSMVYGPAGVIIDVLTQLGFAPELIKQLTTDYNSAGNQTLDLETFNRLSENLIAPLSFTANNQVYALALIYAGADLDRVQQLANNTNGIRYVYSVEDSRVELQRQRVSALGMLLLAYLAVATLLWLVYRSFKSVSLVLIPLASTIITVFLLLMSGQAVSLFHTMALFLVLGLGMDYIIFLTEMKTQSHATLQAIVLSASTSLISFGFLALSSVPAAQSFGITVFIGNAVNLMVTVAVAYSANNNEGAYLFNGKTA